MQIFERSEQLVDDVFDVFMIDQCLAHLLLAVKHLLQSHTRVTGHNVAEKICYILNIFI